MFGKILKSAFFPDKPVHLILHVTDRCNLRCKTCFVDFDKYQAKELELGEIEALAQYLDKVIWLDLSGGEPFLRKDLPEICSKFKAESITIPTNGYNPQLITETARQIREKSDSNITIVLSLDGFENTNDDIREKGSFNKSVETLELLKKIDGIRVKINTVLCEKNYNEIIDFMKFIKEFDVDFHSIIFLRGSARDPQFRSPSYEKLVEIKQDIFNMWESYDYGFKTIEGKVLKNYQRILYETSLKIIKEKRQIPKCLAGKHHLVVYPDGDISFCEMLPPFGNLRESDLGSLLKSDNAERCRRSISNKECYCYHNCNMVDNIFLNPLQYPKLLGGFFK